MDDNYKLITDKIGELHSLYTRMDNDRDAVRLKKYVLYGTGDFRNKEVPDTLSITMNDPQVYASAITAILQNAKRQTVVEGLSDKRNKLIENFIDDLFYTIEEQLSKRIEYQSLWKFACNHVAIRGPIGARFTWGKDGQPVCIPVDMRYCPFETDSESLVWVANGTRRSTLSIRKEYGAIDGVKDGETSNEVYDRWDGKANEIWIEGRMAKTNPNPYGEPPFVIRFPASGFMLLDDGYMEYAGESIFAAVRNLYPEWNRLMSIQQTKAYELVKPPYIHQDNGDGDPQPYPHKVGKNTGYNKDEKPELLQTQDLTRAFQSAQLNVANAVQKGSVNEAGLARPLSTRRRSG